MPRVWRMMGCCRMAWPGQRPFLLARAAASFRRGTSCAHVATRETDTMSRKPELDDFRIPFFDEGKKGATFKLSDFDPGAKPFSSGSKESDREHLLELGTKLDAQQE